MRTVKFVLSVEPDHRIRTTQLVEEIEKLGAVVEENLVMLGILVGTVPENLFEDLENVSGVEHVEIERNVR